MTGSNTHDGPAAGATKGTSATQRRTPVVVVGGGVIGAAVAYELRRAGCAVVLVEQAAFGQGCSHGNCGYVSPSHVLPLCKPGAIWSTLKTLLQPHSPIRIHPRFDPAFWSWMWRFARHCNARDMISAAHARQALLNSSRTLYGDMMDREILTGCDWETRGLLFVSDTQAHFDHYAQTNELLTREFAMPAKPFAGDALLELEPALKPGPAGGWLYECDAHLRPDLLMQTWRHRLAEDGIEIREQCEFQSFDTSQGTVSAIDTSAGRIMVDQVVIATGAWTPLLRDQLKTQIPIEPGKGYSITMPRPRQCPRFPMLFEEHRVGVTPSETSYRIGSTMEFAGYDDSINPRRLQLLIDGATHYLHEPIVEPFTETWTGWRPMSCDGLPLIGAVPGYANVYVAAGHSMLGLSMAPATGRLIAELLTGQTPHLDPQPYRVDRF